MLDIIVKLSPAFVTLILGSIGTYIAFSQYRTSRDKLRLDLFEKRLEAYEKLQEYFNYVARYAYVDEKAFAILREARYKSLFLFGNEITEYIDEVLDKGIGLMHLNLKIDGHDSLPVGEERTRACQEKCKLLHWNDEQQREPPKRYFKYMKFI